MKIVAVETMRLAEFANLCWVRLYTDEGVVGLGETFMGAGAVEAYIHETAAPKLIRPAPPYSISVLTQAVAKTSNG